MLIAKKGISTCRVFSATRWHHLPIEICSVRHSCYVRSHHSVFFKVVISYIGLVIRLIYTLLSKPHIICFVLTSSRLASLEDGTWPPICNKPFLHGRVGSCDLRPHCCPKRCLTSVLLPQNGLTRRKEVCCRRTPLPDQLS